MSATPLRRLRVALATLVLASLGVESSAAGQSPPPDFTREEVRAARQSRLSCDAVAPAVRRRVAPERAELLEAACRRGRFRIEWIMCVFDHSPEACGDRWLNLAQRRVLARALTQTPEEPPAPAVQSESARVDRIRVTEGSLGDAGAGFGRWLHRAAEACASHATPRSETVEVEVVADDDHPGVPVPITVSGASERLRACLESRTRGAHALVWTEGTHARVRARLRVVASAP